MNIGHKLSKLSNRLKRLKKNVSSAGLDRQSSMSVRIAEIETILKQRK